MGISGLLPFLKNASRPVHVREFKGMTCAIDVYCFLHKGAFGCAEQLVQGKPTDAYIKYVMKYIDMLLFHHIKPILVFDGRNLPSKAETEKKRRENRRSNKEKAVQLLSEGKAKEARDYFQRCVDITPQMARDVISASRERNIDCIVAPYEADAQLAYLNIAGLADFIITEDSDLTLFGCDRIVFKMSPNGDGTLYEKSRLNEVFGSMAAQFDFEKFRKMCIMSGCDYMASLPGIGLGKAKQFWSKISNPNLYSILPKIPHYMKMPSLTVTQSYMDGFVQADNTFLYQVVFDPITRRERPLTDYRADVNPDQLSYCGHFSDKDTALQLALGNMDLHTLKQVNNFNPDRFSLGKNAKYGTVAKHQSIWTKGYTSAKSLNNSIMSMSTTSSVMSSKSKEISVTTSFPTMEHNKTSRISSEKRKADVINDDDVEALLLSPEVNKSSNVKPKTNTPSQAKRMKLEESPSNLLRELGVTGPNDVRFTRVLGDNQLVVKNTTVSRYFGSDKVDPAKAAGAGTWFESTNISAKTTNAFIYDPDLPGSQSVIEKDQVKNDGDDTKRNPLEEFARPCRNPFAIKKPLFGKDNDTPKKEQSISQIISEYNKNSNEKPKLKDISNTQKLESLKEFEKSQVKSSTLFSSQEEGGCSTETKSPKSGDKTEKDHEETSPIISSQINKSTFSHFERKSSSPFLAKSASTSLTKSSSLIKKSVKPSGLTKSRGKSDSKLDKNQPTLTSLFAMQAKRANV